MYAAIAAATLWSISILTNNVTIISSPTNIAFTRESKPAREPPVSALYEYKLLSGNHSPSSLLHALPWENRAKKCIAFEHHVFMRNILQNLLLTSIAKETR